MPAEEIPAAPSPEDTLAHLEQFRGVLWLDNPCTVLPGRCVYLAGDAPRILGAASRPAAVRRLESGFFLETSTIPSILSTAEFDEMVRRTELRASDSYICHGSFSQGSGRTVTKGMHQLKGVGRTVHAAWHGFYRDMCGVLSLLDATAELFVSERLRGVLTTPPLPLDFILIPERQTPAVEIARRRIVEPDVRCVLGRRGSPLRLGHLEYLSAALRVTDTARVGSYLVHLLLSHDGGVPRSGIDRRLMSFFTALLRRAVRAAAEARVYGLVHSWWPDNFDLFCRPFDVAESEFLFPLCVLADDEPLPAVRDGESPHGYLSRLAIGTERRATFSLYPIRNVLAAVHLVAREIGMPAARIDALLSWQWLERVYRRDATHAVTRVLGLTNGDASGARALRAQIARLANAFALPRRAAHAPGAVFDWDEQLRRVAPHSALGTALRDRGVARRGHAFRSVLRGSRVRADLARFHDNVRSKVIEPYLAGGAATVGTIAVP